MRIKTYLAMSVLVVIVCASAVAAYETEDVYAAMGLTTEEVLAGTILEAKVVRGSDKQVICIATYFTGKKDKSEAVNVKLGVFNHRGGQLVEIYARDFGAERGGYVANGDLQLLDLDLDKINEIVVSFDRFEDPLIEQRTGEIIVNDDPGFHSAWTGSLEYDATRAARTVPLERRDRYKREIDFANTMRTRGVTLFMNKTVIAVAGERLPEPRSIQETYPLRAAPEG
jgi:hypothetical protein